MQTETIVGKTWEETKVDILLCSECMQRARRHVRRMGYGPWLAAKIEKDLPGTEHREPWSGRHWTGGFRPTAHAYSGKGEEREFWQTLRPSLTDALAGSGAGGSRFLQNPYYEPAVAVIDAASAQKYSYEYEAFELWPWLVQGAWLESLSIFMRNQLTFLRPHPTPKSFSAPADRSATICSPPGIEIPFRR